MALGILVFLLLLKCGLCTGGFVGVNYGTQFSASPSPQQVVGLLRRQSITNLRLYDANSSMLQALAHSGIRVMVTVPNTQLLSVGASNATAANWITTNVLPFLPNTNITAICVGTEVLTSNPNAAPVLLPAMRFLYAALQAANLSSQIKISTTHDPSLILDNFPPSQAFFNRSWDPVIQPMLDFLSTTGSFFMLNVYPYDIYKASNGILPLDYALMNNGAAVTDSNTLLQYRSLYDAVLDSAFFALERLNHSLLPVTVSESGWPSATDDSTDTDASPENASVYVSNLIAHVLNNTGTPKRPKAGATLNAYVFELFNEDTRVGAPATRHYGLFNASTLQAVYTLRLSNSGALLANDTSAQLFCVAKGGANEDALQIALDWACGIGRANCSALQPGQLCFVPNTVQYHASYAFDTYYQAHNRSQLSCDFNGVATVSTTDPSTSVCIFPGSSNSTTNTSANGTTTNSTVGPISGNSTDDNTTSAGIHFHLTRSSMMPHVQIACTLAALLLVMGLTAQF